MSERRIAEAFPPGEFIKEELEARGWSQIDLAEILGRHPNVVSEIITGKRAISLDTAKALGQAFGTSAQYWMNLHSIYQLWQSQEIDEAIPIRAKLYEVAPVKEMVKRNWIEYSENVEVLQKRMLQFFETTSFDEPLRPFAHAARKSTSYESALSPSQIAWLVRANKLAKAIDAAPFTKRSFLQGLVRINGLLAHAEEIRHVPRVLAETGIRFLVLEHLPQTKIDGVTFWLNPKSPVIVLSLRYDRIDYFWFSLYHELGHIKNRDGQRNILLDIDLVGDEAQSSATKPEEEQRADQFATDTLIDSFAMLKFISRVRPLYGRREIIGFANRIAVHPGIVVGQLQHRNEVKYSHYRRLLEKARTIITQSALTDGWGHTPPTLAGGRKNW